MRHAVIDKNTNIVKNVIQWSGAPWTPPEGTYTVANEKVNIGDIYDQSTNSFKRSPNPVQ